MNENMPEEREEPRLLQILREASPATKIINAVGRDLGIADGEPFPFLGVIGQEEMKLALLLSVINPRIGGVLLIGSRGTAKTTAVRSLLDLLPIIQRSMCPNGRGCTKEIFDAEGMDGVCNDCARRAAYDEPLVEKKQMRIVELPLNANITDVVGGINERTALEKQKVQLERGLLGQADDNLLYIDEVNLLDDGVIDAILDAAAQGFYIVRRGANNLTYNSRFVLVGSMNPEEGALRPQIMDRFGLRVVVRGLADSNARYEAYERAMWHRQDATGMSSAYAEDTLALAAEIQKAVDLLPHVVLGEEAKAFGLALVQKLRVESSRAEITLFEAARANAAADERTEVSVADVQAVALLALRQRQSPKLEKFFVEQDVEDTRLQAFIGGGDAVG